MRKTACAILTLVLCLSLLVPAAAAAQAEDACTAMATNNAIVVSNSTDTPDAHLVRPAVYKIEGYNYFKLRDVAMLLNGSERQFAVEYDEASKSISITTGLAYRAVGGELTGTAGESRSAAVSNNPVSIDGSAVTLTAFKIDGENYFKLRDLGEALDFCVGYDDELKTVFISGAKGYEKESEAGS